MDDNADGRISLFEEKRRRRHSSQKDRVTRYRTGLYGIQSGQGIIVGQKKRGAGMD